jgi:cyclophilin family peptidyl-prolyl cis-trans isomerase
MENDVKLTYGVIAGLIIVLAVLAFFLQGNLGIDTPDQVEATSTISSTSVKPKPVATTQASTTQTTMTIPENVTKAVITTNKGVIEFTFSTSTPLAVENFKKLSASGFYNGTRFHRVINDFMIQGGDPLSKDVTKKNVWGTGGPGYTFKDETTPNDKMVQGVVAMANAGPNTNGSQFFIITAQAGTPWLVGKHTPFGVVTKGMDVVMLIQNVQVDGSDKPLQDITVEKVELQ